MTPAQTRVFGPGIIIIGLGLMAVGLHDQHSFSQLREHGSSAPGEITGGRVSTGKKKSYYLTVKWTNEGVGRSDEFLVKESYVKGRTDEEGHFTNTAVLVRHHPGQPSSAIIDGGDSNHRGIEWVGGSGLLGGIYYCFKGFRRREKEVHPSA